MQGNGRKEGKDTAEMDIDLKSLGYQEDASGDTAPPSGCFTELCELGLVLVKCESEW